MDGIPRLPLRMHFLIAAWDTVVESELEWLGLAAEVLETEPILTGPRLTPVVNGSPATRFMLSPMT